MHLKIELELPKEVRDAPSNSIATAISLLLMQSMGRFGDTPNDMLSASNGKTQILHEGGTGTGEDNQLEEVTFRITLYAVSMDQRQLLPAEEVTNVSSPRKITLEA